MTKGTSVGSASVSVGYKAVWNNTDKCQIRVGASAPAARMKDGHVLCVVEKDKAVKACPGNKPLSIGIAASEPPWKAR